MADSTTEKTGSCLCGAIQLKIKGDPLFTNLCHCISCQKTSGSVFASIAAYKSEQVIFTAAPGTMQTYDDGSALSGNSIERSWCAHCGSRVKNVSARAGFPMVALPTGVIDGDKGDLKPRLELFCANREEWLGEIERAEQFTGMPPVPGSQ
ncbi:Mss4-like protein [Xylariales sp. AK1849]|nr:Mss4-like protein [Xylariales sp. AK1849]